MKAFRISVPFEFHLSIAAENEEQAKRIAVAITQTPVVSMFDGCSTAEAIDAVGGAFWDAHKDDPNSVTILDEEEPQYWHEKGRNRFAELLGNKNELQQAKETK